MCGIALNRRQIAVAAALWVAFGSASPRAQVSGSEVAAQRLKSVGVYAFGGVGFAGRISQGERDYRAVLSEPRDEALRLFEDVFAHGNSAGKSYALVGIHRLDPDKFKELYEGVAASDEVVVTMSGCIMSRSKLKDLAKGINKGADRGSK